MLFDKRTFLVMHCEPATSIIAALGGITAVSRATKTSTVTVQRWRFPKEKGGTGGFIPRKHHGPLMALGKARGIDLPAAAFVDLSFVPAAEQAAQ